jgi:hypothetical protein
VAVVPFHERRIAGSGAATEVGHRDRLALQQGRDLHAAILAPWARRGNGKRHVEQGLAARAARALDRPQPTPGNGAAIGGNPVRGADGTAR